MLESARQNINNGKIKYQVIDIQDIPYEDESFDIIIARHMIYHVPDIDKAFTEVKRVLKPKGKFYCSTNGKEHLKELGRFMKSYDENIEFDPEKYANKFGIESGYGILKQYFSSFVLEEYNGLIVVDRAEPVVSYVTSMIGNGKYKCDPHKLSSLNKYVEDEINKTGAIKITTRAGMFTCLKTEIGGI